jgi:hypothetical protein
VHSARFPQHSLYEFLRCLQFGLQRLHLGTTVRKVRLNPPVLVIEAKEFDIRPRCQEGDNEQHKPKQQERFQHLRLLKAG